LLDNGRLIDRFGIASERFRTVLHTCNRPVRTTHRLSKRSLKCYSFLHHLCAYEN